MRWLLATGSSVGYNPLSNLSTAFSVAAPRERIAARSASLPLPTLPRRAGVESSFRHSIRPTGRPMRPFLPFVLLSLAAALPTADAQTTVSSDTDARWLENCENGWNGDRDRGRACEVRNVPVRLSGRSIEIDGRQN